MFNNLANYLLGTASNHQQQQEEEEERNNALRHEANNIRLTAITDDDEWVLVDRDSEGNSELSSEESETEDMTHVEQLDNLLLTRTSSTSSLPCNNSATALEESWFLTPPPCFISAGPVHMETSPLENLLIEHPSMSVYQQPVLRRPVLAVLEAVVDVDADEEFLQVTTIAQPAAATTATPAAATLLPRVANRALVRAEVHVKQAKQGLKNAQKVQIQKARQSLKRGYLERHNKAREVNCRNQRLRRGARSQGATRSHANNNRKC